MARTKHFDWSKVDYRLRDEDQVIDTFPSCVISLDALTERQVCIVCGSDGFSIAICLRRPGAGEHGGNLDWWGHVCPKCVCHPKVVLALLGVK